MRPHPRRIEWHAILTLVLTLPALLPLLFSAGLSATGDAPLYIARSMQIADLLRSGVLYSRWAPDYYNGLGSPLFNYLAPLPHYLAGYYQVLTDASGIDSIRLLNMLMVPLLSLGVYLLVKVRLSAVAGVLTAVIITYSPLMIALRETGNLAALTSLALLPWTLWALDRIGRPSSPRRDLLVGGVLVALWCLCDSPLTLVGLPLLAVIIVSAPNRWRVVGVVVAGVMLTAFYGLPALLERDQVVYVPISLDAEGKIAVSAMRAPEGFHPVTGVEIVLTYGTFGIGVLTAFAMRLLVRLPNTRVQDCVTLSLCALAMHSAGAHILPASYVNSDQAALNTMNERVLGIYGSLRGGVLLPVTAYRPVDQGVVLAFTRIQNSNPDRPAFPTTLGVQQVERLPLSSRYAVNLDNPEYSRFDRYYFIGWSVSVDGVNYEAQSDALGYATHPVPASARELTLSFGTTQGRSLGWLVTLTGAVWLLGWLRWGSRRI